MNRFGLAVCFSLLAGAAAAQNLGYSPEESAAVPGAKPIKPRVPAPSAISTPAPVTAPATPPASGSSSPTAGIVGMRGAMIARKGTIYETLTVGATTPAFMTITNESTTPDTLTSVACTIADTSDLVDGAGKPLGPVSIMPNKPFAFTPAGPHLVLRNMHYTVPAGATVPCSVSFKYAGAIQAYLFAVPNPGPKEP